MRKILIGTMALTMLGTAACSNLGARENEVLRDAGIGAAAGAAIGGALGGALGGGYGIYKTR